MHLHIVAELRRIFEEEGTVLAPATASRPLQNRSYPGSQLVDQMHPPKMQKRSLVALSWKGLHHLVLKKDIVHQ